MASEVTVRQGNTNNIRMSLLADSTVIDLTNAQKVVIMIKSSDGILTTHDSSVATSGCVITTPASGIVDFYPYSTTYSTSRVLKVSESPYKIYAWVYPNATPDTTKYSVPETTEILLYVRNE